MTDRATDPVGEWLARFATDHPSAQVVDVGGGTGARAVPLARRGCDVLVVDSSTDALASLARRAAEAGVSGRISALQADADQLATVVRPASADLVLYHRVLQTIDDPARTMAAIVGVLRPGGRLSVLAAGRLSAVLGEALAGRFAAAEAMLDTGSPADRRYDVPSLQALLQASGLTVESVTGVGVVAGLRAAAGRGSDADDPALAQLEWMLGRHPVLGQVAGELHALGLKPSS